MLRWRPARMRRPRRDHLPGHRLPPRTRSMSGCPSARSRWRHRLGRRRQMSVGRSTARRACDPGRPRRRGSQGASCASVPSLPLPPVLASSTTPPVCSRSLLQTAPSSAIAWSLSTKRTRVIRHVELPLTHASVSSRRPPRMAAHQAAVTIPSRTGSGFSIPSSWESAPTTTSQRSSNPYASCLGRVLGLPRSCCFKRLAVP